MSKIIILQNAEAFSAGRIIPVFSDFGIPLEIRRLYKGDEVPADLDEIRMLIVLSAPFSVGDTAGHSYLAKESELLKKFVAADRAVLGIGLGAQLLASAAGAKVYPNAKPGAKPEDAATPLPEFGWGPVSFPFPGGTEPIVMGGVDGSPMFHWHTDTFDLPKLPGPANPPPGPPPPTGNSLLSSSKLCRNQAFRFKTRLFGFQYHLELTQSQIEQIAAAPSDAARAALGPGALARIAADTARHYPRYARLGDKILSNFVQFLKVY